MNFNSEWKFFKADPGNAHLADLDDSHWRSLDLPHDWAIEGPFTKNVSHRAGYLPFPGVGWYRKHFTVADSEKRYLVEFDGVMRGAKVYVNGELVGEWPYGYSSFAFDITSHLKFDEENLIAVRVENDDNSSRWYPGSGIYRNVWLTITHPVHIAHWGTYITTPSISDEQVEVSMVTEVKNESDNTRQIVLKTRIVDAEGLQVANNETTSEVPSGSSLSVEQNFTIDQPSRWDLSNPAMYTAFSALYENDILIDDYETPFGIREFRFDPEDGFFLNGRHFKIKGVNMHHGLGPLGIAVNKRAIERQLEILKEMGVNAIRTAHNPPAPEQLDLCDRIGLLVIDETFDEWTVGKIPNGYNLLFDEWSEKDTRALLKRDRNHPSIILWSIGNEIPELDSGSGVANAQRFVDICHEMDPTRPVTAGVHLTTDVTKLVDILDVVGLNYWQDRYELLHESFPDKVLLPTETSAVVSSRGKYYFPLERDPNDQTPPEIWTPEEEEEDPFTLAGQTFTTRIEGEDYTWVFEEDGQLVVSGGEAGDGTDGEYEQEGEDVFIDVGGYYLEARYTGDEFEITEVSESREKQKGPLQVSSYDLVNCGFGDLPDVEFRQQDKHAWLPGEFVWSGFDYHGEPDPYEDMWPAHSSFFGIVDMCGFKKDRFYLYQSKWTEEPMVHLLPHWNWEGREGEVTPVYVYTNCQSAELFVNGESQGVKSKEEGIYRLVWEDIEYQPGSVRVVGLGGDGNILAEKEIKTAGEPARIHLSADRKTISSDNDLVFITATITDINGNICPDAVNLVEFSVEGDGVIVSVGNGNPISHEDYKGNKRKAFSGKCLAIVGSTGAKGVIKVEAVSSLLESDMVSVKVK